MSAPPNPDAYRPLPETDLRYSVYEVLTQGLIKNAARLAEPEGAQTPTSNVTTYMWTDSAAGDYIAYIHIETLPRRPDQHVLISQPSDRLCEAIAEIGLTPFSQLDRIALEIEFHINFPGSRQEEPEVLYSAGSASSGLQRVAHLSYDSFVAIAVASGLYEPASAGLS